MQHSEPSPANIYRLILGRKNKLVLEDGETANVDRSMHLPSLPLLQSVAMAQEQHLQGKGQHSHREVNHRLAWVGGNLQHHLVPLC